MEQCKTKDIIFMFVSRLGGGDLSLPLLTPIKEGVKCFRLMLVPFLLQQFGTATQTQL
jgi:hypothetical protein